MNLVDTIRKLFESENNNFRFNLTIKNEKDILNMTNNSTLSDSLYIFIDNLNFDIKNSEFIFFKKNFTKEKESFVFEDILKKISSFNNCDEIETLNNYNNYLNTEFIFKYSKEFLNKKFRFLNLWNNYKMIVPVEISGKIITGFKRGSKLLGVPTANIEITEEIKEKIDYLHTGVYFGEFFFKNKNNNSEMFKAVLSIGYNPYFDNAQKTIEVFLINYEGEDFYDALIDLIIKGFIRTEASFENFAELVTAITYDIITTDTIFKI